MPSKQSALDDNWISNDLDNKIKHFEEVRKGFIEEMTNTMSKAFVPSKSDDHPHDLAQDKAMKEGSDGSESEEDQD